MSRAVDVVIASANMDKVKEMLEILPDPQIRFRTMKEAGFRGTIVEDGVSFEENARIKAQAVHAVTGGYVLADDSGLSVDLLDGAPGVLSARFAGENAGYPEKIAFLQKMLSPWEPGKWDAEFVCVMVLVRPDGSEAVTRGSCRGRISPVSLGSGGFGYDPVFWLPDIGLTMAQLSPEEKHKISHRGQALRKMACVLRRELGTDGRLLSASEAESLFAGCDRLKILVFSDSHRRTEFMERCVSGHPDADLILHLGDHGDDCGELARMLGKPLVGVAGNNDGWLGSKLPGQLVLNLAGKRFFVTHGHAFGVKHQPGSLAEFAAGPQIRADVVLFGHTHHAVDRTADCRGRSLRMMNPGAARSGYMSAASAILLDVGPEGLTRTWLLDEPQKPVI